MCLIRSTRYAGPTSSSRIVRILSRYWFACHCAISQCHVQGYIQGALPFSQGNVGYWCVALDRLTVDSDLAEEVEWLTAKHVVRDLHCSALLSQGVYRFAH
jgi:hypothetical protein